MTVQEIYDFENIIPTAFASALKTAGLQAFTLSDVVAFQKIRPRCEVAFNLGGSIGPIDPATCKNKPNDGRNIGWTGTLELFMVTATDASGKASHSTYRANVRNVAATLMQTVNNAQTLPYHYVNRVTENGNRHGFDQEHGEEVSVVSYEVAFGIQAGVWTSMGTN